MTTAADARRYEPLIELAKRREEEAAVQLAEALRLEANAQDRGMELTQYEAEYSQRIPTGVCGPAALSRQAQFVAKLREAVDFQARRLVELTARTQQARTRWLAAHQEVEKLTQLQAQLTEQQRHHEQRKQDREQDDRNSSRHHRRLAA